MSNNFDAHLSEAVQAALKGNEAGALIACSFFDDYDLDALVEAFGLLNQVIIARQEALVIVARERRRVSDVIMDFSTDLKKHSTACIDKHFGYLSAYMDYLFRWPSYCRTCNGSPYHMDSYSVCPDCLSNNICPRCSQPAISLENNGAVCEVCGWRSGAAGLPVQNYCICGGSDE